MGEESTQGHFWVIQAIVGANEPKCPSTIVLSNNSKCFCANTHLTGTFQGLVESGQKKDELFRRLQERGPGGAGTSSGRAGAAPGAPESQAEMARLKTELEKKNGRWDY